jgi:hypothetical protein
LNFESIHGNPGGWGDIPVAFHLNLELDCLANGGL